MRKNYDMLMKMLTRCKDILVELDIKLPRKSSNMPTTSRPLRLPLLRKLIIRINHGFKFKDISVKGWDFVYSNYQFHTVDVQLLNNIL